MGASYAHVSADDPVLLNAAVCWGLFDGNRMAPHSAAMKEVVMGVEMRHRDLTVDGHRLVLEVTIEARRRRRGLEMEVGALSPR